MKNKYYAGFFIRLLAYLIDLNLLSAFSFPVMMLSFFVMMTIFPKGNIVVAFMTVGILLLFLIYDYFILTTYFFGTTVGKKLLELEVKNKDNTRVSLIRIIVRETIGRILSGIIFLGYIWIFFNREKRSFHDIIAGTVVLRDTPARKSEKILGIILILIFIVILCLFLFMIRGIFNNLSPIGGFKPPIID